MNNTIIKEDALKSLKKTSNNISDLIDDMQMKSIFENEEIPLKLIKKVKKLITKINKL